MISGRFAYSPGVPSLYPPTERRLAAVQRLLRKLTDGTYRLEDVPCACGGGDDEELATRDRFGLPTRTVICRSCGIVRINPRMSEDSYARFYSEEYLDLKTLETYADPAERVRAVHQSERTHAKRIYRWIAEAEGVSFGTGEVEPRLADVGCGSGGMVAYFQEQGFEGCGCDYDRDSVDYGRTLGLDITVGDAATIRDRGPADVVLLSHVFEHVTSPFGMLDSLVALMHPGSLLYIELPGILDVSMRRYRNDFLRYLRFVHTFNYSLETLTNVLESRGFELVRGDQWIHALFRYTGAAPRQMRPQPEQYERIVGYVRALEWQRHLYPAYRLYRGLRSAAAKVVRRAAPSTAQR